MFNLQGSEIIFILLLALVVLGPEKLPGAVKRAMQTYHELRKLGTGFQDEFKSAIDQPMREMRETADLMKEQIDPKKFADDAQRAVEAAAAADRADAELVAAGDATDSVDDLDEVGAEGESTPDRADDFDEPFDDPFDDPIDDVDEPGGVVDDDATSDADAPMVEAGEPTTPSLIVDQDIAGIEAAADEPMEESA